MVSRCRNYDAPAYCMGPPDRPERDARAQAAVQQTLVQSGRPGWSSRAGREVTGNSGHGPAVGQVTRVEKALLSGRQQHEVADQQSTPYTTGNGVFSHISQLFQKHISEGATLCRADRPIGDLQQ